MVGPVRERQFGGIILSVLLIGGVGGAFYLDSPFQPSRPRGTDIELFHRAGLAPARQWQDPFSAVYDKIENHENHEKQTRHGQRFKDQLQQVRNGESPIIMPVMVFGGSYAEQIESRRRSRYAVLSALYVNGYRPLDSEHIGFVVMDVPARHPPSSKDDTARVNPQKYMPNKDHAPLKMTIPYEWFVVNTASYGKNPPHPPILLLWLDDFEFERDSFEPLRTLADVVNNFGRLIEPIGVPRAKIGVKIIGPAGSTMLRAMVKNAWTIVKPGTELNSETPESLHRGADSRDAPSDLIFDSNYVEIYSPTATASAKLIIQDIESGLREKLGWAVKDKCSSRPNCKTVYPAKGRKDNNNALTSLYFMESLFRKLNMLFYRTILSDRWLLNEFVQNELPKWRVDVCDPDHTIAVISEWDTFYGRALPEAFMAAIEQARDEEYETDDGCETRPSPGDATSETRDLYRFVYMRGLDGETLIKDEKTARRYESRRDEDKEKNQKPLERAAGDSQTDLLRRLATDIKDSFAQSDADLKVIGVLGSDVYDKLLVLQALRPRFPQTKFFTTDLDARYLHRLEKSWAKNLLVVSTFGLKPELYLLWPALSPIKIEPPVFRDSYQTSVFTAVHIALTRPRKFGGGWVTKEDSDAELRYLLATNLRPKVFEIGRDRAYLLGAPLEFDSKRILFLVPIFLLLVFLIFMSWAYRNWLYLVAPLTAFLSAAIVFGVAYSQSSTGEPLGLASGISIWPSEAIRLFALFLAVGLLVYARRNLEEDRANLTENYMLGDAGPAPKPTGIPASVFGRIRLSDHAATPSSPDTDNTVKTLWNRYLDIDAASETQLKCRLWNLFRNYRFRRVLFLAAMYLLFGLAVLLIEYPHPPARGETAFWADIICLYSAVFALLVLLFYVVDVTFACRRFVELLGGKMERAYAWPIALLEETVKTRLSFSPGKKNLSFFALAPGESWHADWRAEIARHWLNVKLIGERTETIGSLVYFPAVIMPLMIVSRSGIFDDWDFPIGLIIVITISVSVLLAAIILLYVAARGARENALGSMRALLPQANASTDESASENARLLIEDVETTHRGAFRPLVEQPLIRALLLPSGGVGGLILIERFLQ